MIITYHITKYEQVSNTRDDIRRPELLAQLVFRLVVISPVAVDMKISMPGVRPSVTLRAEAIL